MAVNNNISFTSNIVPVSTKAFYKIERNIGLQNYASFPWIPSTSVKGQNVYTNGVIDCTSCLISDTKEGLMMHLTPAYDNNHDFDYVLGFLRCYFDLANKNLHAILMGSKNTTKSLDIYNKFVKLLKDFRIPFSEFRNGKAPSHMAYNSQTDEVFISNDVINNAMIYNYSHKDILKAGFEEVHIGERDLIK